MANKVSDFSYAIIGNIPEKYHSSDLRNFFSQFIETGGFDCFHFRHRPETIISENPSNSRGSSKSLCCVVRLKKLKSNELIKMYHKKHWIDKHGDCMLSVCLVSPIHLSDLPSHASDTVSQKYKTRKEQRSVDDRQTFIKSDLSRLIELKPPEIMPNGNVGTPTKVFLELIKACKLPPVIIKNLGLTFPKTRSSKRYGDVPFDYGGDVIDGGNSDDETQVESGSGQSIEQTEKFCDDEETSLEPQSEDDNDTCEEWERHEAMYDDPSDMERNKERLFEEKIELKWEKGGSGLVWYTDAQYWDEQQGDFDERTADDWDVDMSGYYDEGEPDMDARDWLTMRQEQRRRDGIEKTNMVTAGIGNFENHTKGIGRRVMEKQGWREGIGLGAGQTGIAEALTNDGQKPKDKKGIGYRGEKLSRFTAPRKRSKPDDVIISTIFDNPTDNDPPEPLLRSNEPYHLKYRNSVPFVRGKTHEPSVT